MDWIEKEITSLVGELHMAYDDERFLLGSHISLKYWIHNSLVQQALETITAASTDVPEDDVLGKKASDFAMIMGLVVSEPLFWADATEEQWNNLTLERLDSLENSVYDRMNACLHSLRWGYLDMLQSPIETRNQLEKELAQLWKISERLCTKKVASHGLSPILVLQEVNSHNLHSTFDATLSNDKHERHSPSTLFQQALNLIAVQATFLSDVIFPVCKDGCEVILDKYFTAWIQEFATGILAHRLEVVLRLDKDLLGEYIHEIKYFEDHYPSIIQPSLRVSSVLAQENIFQSWVGQDLTCVRQLVRQAIKDFERISKDELKNRHWVDLHSVSRIVSKLFTYLSDRYSFVAPYLKQDQLKFMWKELVVKGLSEFSDLLCASPIESTNLSVASLAEILQACMFLHWELRRFSDGLPFVLMKSDDPCMDYMQEYELRVNSCLKKIHDIMTSRENLCLVQKYLRELDVALKWAVPRGKVLEMLDYVYLQKIFVENTWTPHTVIAVFWTPLLPRCLAAVKIITRSTTSERALYLDNRGQGSNGRPFRDVPMSSVNLLGHETILRLLSKTT